MPLYVTREVSKIWKRIAAEFFVEWQLLLEKWKFLLFGIVFQYIHGVFAKVVHYLHRPAPLLPDIGFVILPELGLERAYISETLFSCIFFLFVLWTFHPFLFNKKRFYTVLLWHRVLAVLVVSQALRIVTFLSTQLPGPNYHCREGSPAATLPPPKNIAEVININFPYGVIYGCGDLIFSSHMIFAIVFVRTYQKYGTKRWIKRLAWAVNVVLGLLIIASRKHYTVDVVVAWYTVLLVFYFVDRQLSGYEITERSAGVVSPLLPSNMKAKDGRSKDESQKLMNGHMGSTMGDLASETRQRTPINGKISDEGNSTTSDLALNGNQLV
ncbi:hypothetical protein O6H91_10G007700 [Diphasiastrum complanatum]|uniref:Uncharacterized protein n=4 Tax=Diphasiastrum complanatum TaxID=34168 RepID=A0ACC2CF32_DIPCM|nr:hypothetical protein O6H91_10G007700 [Diphasiastrum complanatum]KAJ7540286.1 hypothetical protein O6H91_10G007700 [Diphasiastrum complanatum]KAJ7540287.1 hypothetical protein O6H91_10G007700 [Diphasiastrum complanatum]KAJ7540288.1 hypothetical protein O6H91_10G007700 [Diphasiastrum complanatum]